ncbi:hypothetical protein EON83_30185 [bacterium]|nr:MAG: hypothetical protein EON83_30185 [bacterium]
MQQSITLNIPYDLPQEDWGKISSVYQTLDGWIEHAEWPSWYGNEGDDKYIVVSSEPSGLLFTAEVESSLWTTWVSVLCSRLTLALGREVRDAEM